MRTSRRLITLALGTVLLLAACSDPPPDAAATVDGTQVSDADVALVSRVLQAVGSIQQTPCGQVEPTGDTPEAACDRVSVGLWLQFRLAQAYAAEHDIAVTDAELADALDLFTQSLGDEALDGALTTFGTNREEFTAVLRDSLLQQEVARAMVEAELGEDGLRQAYEDTAVDHTTVQVDHILVESQEEAQDVYEQVTAPGATRDDFLALAQDISLDPSAADNSGSLASAPASQYVPDFAEAAIALENGEISEPVQTEFGWHVIRMEDKEVTPFAEVREDILASRSSSTFAEYMRVALDEGRIEVNPRFGVLDRQTLLINRIHSTDPSSSPSPSGDGAIDPPA